MGTACPLLPHYPPNRYYLLFPLFFVVIFGRCPVCLQGAALVLLQRI